MIGQRFGRWVVIEAAAPVTRRAAWLCRCDCGKERAVVEGSLRRGLSKSCGCNRQNNTGNRSHGHLAGYRPSPTYRVWQCMLTRCTNPKSDGYARYGARGITVCDRWRQFENFLADMGERPAGTTIDRLENDKGYQPGNCRWATGYQQAQNQVATCSPEEAAKIVFMIERGADSDALRQLGCGSTLIKKLRRGLHWTQRDGLVRKPGETVADVDIRRAA